MKDHRVWVTVPMLPDMKERIEKAAAKNERSVSEYMRIAVRTYMEKERKRMDLAWSEEGVRMTDEAVQARIDALKEKGDASAEEAAKPREETINWNEGLKEGDMIAGILERGAMVEVGERKELRHLMEIRDHETKDLYTVWCGSFMLAQQVVDKAPKVGSLVVVQYHGKQESNKNPGRMFNVFSIEAEEADFQYWNDITTAAYAKKQATPTVVPAVNFGPDEAPF